MIVLHIFKKRSSAFSLSLLALADFQEEGIIAEEMRLIAVEEASDRLFSDQGLFFPREEGYAMGARDLRAKRRMEENNDRR